MSRQWRTDSFSEGVAAFQGGESFESPSADRSGEYWRHADVAWRAGWTFAKSERDRDGYDLEITREPWHFESQVKGLFDRYDRIFGWSVSIFTIVVLVLAFNAPDVDSFPFGFAWAIFYILAPIIIRAFLHSWLIDHCAPQVWLKLGAINTDARPVTANRAKLSELKEMLDDGVISQKDYEDKKSEILDRM